MQLVILFAILYLARHRKNYELPQPRSMQNTPMVVLFISYSKIDTFVDGILRKQDHMII